MNVPLNCDLPSAQCLGKNRQGPCADAWIEPSTLLSRRLEYDVVVNLGVRSATMGYRISQSTPYLGLV